MTNNVESCKKINGRVQTFRFSVFTMGRQELHAENAKKNTNFSYRPSKMDESEKTGPSPKISGVKKKDTATILKITARN